MQSSNFDCWWVRREDEHIDVDELLQEAADIFGEENVVRIDAGSDDAGNGRSHGSPVVVTSAYCLVNCSPSFEGIKPRLLIVASMYTLKYASTIYDLRRCGRIQEITHSAENDLRWWSMRLLPVN